MAQPPRPVHQEGPNQPRGGADDLPAAQVVGQQVGGHREGVAWSVRQLHQELLLLYPPQAPAAHQQESEERLNL